MRNVPRKLRRILGPALAAGSLGALAIGVGSAGATTVTPAGADWTATADKTSFMSQNGNGVEVTCESSTATGTNPGPPAASPPNAGPAYHYNAVTGGSVIGPIHSLEFTGNCTAAGIGATVDTENSGQGYTLSASGDHLSDGLSYVGDGNPAVAINIPGDGTLIDVSGICTITTPNDQTDPVAGSPFGTFVNGTDNQTDPSELYVKGQLPFDETCGLPANSSQGVFFANGEDPAGTGATDNYTVVNDNATGNPIQINP